MQIISKNLYITYSNQKARDLKHLDSIKPFDKIVTLDSLIFELFEKNNFMIIIDEVIASSIIYKIIQEENILYFSYLLENAKSLGVIYDYITNSKRCDVLFQFSGEKLDSIVKIDKAYKEYKQKNNLVDIADIEKIVLENWDSYFKNSFDNIYIDDFKIEDISYIKSKIQEDILKKFPSPKSIKKVLDNTTTKIIKPSNIVFDNIDEVKIAIKIVRKLIENGEKSDDIIIVASDINEYAPLYKLFVDEYEIKGFSSVGTPLSSFHNYESKQVAIAMKKYKTKIKSLELLYKKLDITLTDTTKENLKSSIMVLDEKIGIEMTEPNQLVGLSKKYKHIIFIGTDINHFPPKASGNFLSSYEDDIKYFYKNNYFTSSETQLNELKRLSENLYIITATYNGKRELTPSILIDDRFDDIIELSDIKSKNDLSLENKTVVDDDSLKYYESIKSEDFTIYDGAFVDGIDVSHLSASQINRYLQCPFYYLYSNKLKLKSPSKNEEGFDVMEQGSLMHLCFEMFGRYIKENNLKTVDKDELYQLMHTKSLEAYKKMLEDKDENIHHNIFLLSLQSGLKNSKKAGVLSKFVDYYIEKADEFNHFADSEFEKEFALDEELKPYKLKNEDDENYFIKGFIDRFDNLEKRINIIDYKSKKMNNLIDKDKMQQIEELNDVQLALYILYAKQDYPNKEYVSHLLSFKGDRAYYHFANLSNTENLKNTLHYTPEYETKLKEVIFKTKKDIEDGKFSFNNSDEKMCRYCDIKHICHESVLSKKF